MDYLRIEGRIEGRKEGGKEGGREGGREGGGGRWEKRGREEKDIYLI